MPLTDAKIRNAKPKTKPFKLADANGLYLLVNRNGSKLWRYKYRFAAKERLLAIGAYPEVGLAEARERHQDARRALAAGANPASVKRKAKLEGLLKAENNFETMAKEWHEHHRHEWVSGYSKKMMKRLEMYIFPDLGRRPMTEIDPPELLSVLRKVEKTGALDLTMRLKQICGQIFMYAIATGRAVRNPVPDLEGALKTPVRAHHAYLKADELPEYFHRLENYHGLPHTKLALRVLALTFVRTTELRAAQWGEINFDNAEWRIPAERMKMKDPHIVPLSRQVLELFRELKKHGGNRNHVFPNYHKPMACMSENTLLFALYRMGYHSRATGHGFRATASTILNEHGFAPDVIERQLAHCERNGVRAAYNHAQYLPQRREMMQWWANYIDEAAKKGVTALAA